MRSQSFTCLAGKKVKKSHELLEILGQLDRLSSELGVVRAFTDNKLNQRLLTLQEQLIAIGGWLSGTAKQFELGEWTGELEKEIEKLCDPGLREFSRPGANELSAFLHLARVTARSAERAVVRLDRPDFQPLVNFLNRLSEFLFWLAVREEKK